MQTIRQGDVLLVKIEKMPGGCAEVPHIDGSIVLAFGEITGHKHQIADWKDAGRQARNALHRTKARLFIAKDGSRFLEVTKPVTLKHEEHSPAKIAPGVYELPTQMEHSVGNMPRRVTD